MLELFRKIFESPITELNLLEIIIGVLTVYIAYLLIVRIVKPIINGIKYFFKFIKVSITSSEKCKKIQCTSCGRTLDKCVCLKNNGKSNFARLMLYKKEQKQKKK